ncbi:hypothetical protein Lgra_2316 [Legionella gratiana]|uniref:Uncharacterized protein n=1 Tax=Legionella gratiana TaxID=45066 RepID=A0A378JEE6_9GAMM|nr:hypothetical protein [Legionella gratiana]KTD09081.1 hypothetical protein Lgra_2316 [Legionella gratiana]STX45706.1 Uncharacterised protein [Legionella gratiana]
MKRFFTVGKELITKKSTRTLLPSRTFSKSISAGENSLLMNELSKKIAQPLATKIPDARFFEKLKREEHQQFSPKKRRRFSYSDNRSAALSLPYSTEQLATKQNDQEALLGMSKKSIIEHANRRVDLFFYTLIAYYKTSFFPTYAQTTLQHGTGRTINKGCITEACHSSFTPSLLDNIIYQNKDTGEKLRSLLSDTHLQNSLNSTVELPPFVNDLDDVLENTCRPECIEIIRRTSIGEINPIEGLTIFLKMMHDVLEDLKEKAEPKSPSSLSHHSVLKQKSMNPVLIDLVTTGTLSNTFSDETQTVMDEYIQLLLRMKPDEKKLCEKKGNKEKIYLKKITEIQEEILYSKRNQNSMVLD